MKEIIQQLDPLFKEGFINSGIAIIIVFITIIIINSLANKLIRKKWPNDNYLAIRIKRIIIFTIAISTIAMQIKPLQSLVTALLASGGILALIIGFASQEAASNIINGFMIFIYKPYTIGDFVVIHEHSVSGKVIDISLRHSIVETLERTQVIIPNTIMNKAIIENVSNISNRKANHLFIDISFESDIDKAIKVIQEETMKHPLFIDGRSKKEKNHADIVPVHCIAFKESSIALRATIFSKDNVEGFQLLSDLRINIKKKFDQEGINIPYPHRVNINRNGDA